MASEYDDDVDIPLRDGLDIEDLRQGEGQVFEVDEERMKDIGKCANNQYFRWMTQFSVQVFVWLF